MVPVRSRWVAVSVALGVVLVLDIGARLIDDDLPEPLEWQSVEAAVKVGQMESLDRAEVALVGSSVVNGDVVPSILASRLGRTVYNAGLSAGFAPTAERWVDGVVLPELEPEVLVHGLISFDLHAHPSHAVFEEALTTSPAGRHAFGTESAVDVVDRALGDVSALWRHRRSLREPVTVYDAIRGDTEPPRPEFGAIGRLGRAHYDHATQADAAEQVAAGGGVPVGEWQLDEHAVERVRQLVRTARAEGVAVVLVAMPVSQDYIDKHPRGEADQQAYHRRLERLAVEESVPLLDLDTMRDPDLYLDGVHLDEDGARSFTTALADALAPVVAAA